MRLESADVSEVEAADINYNKDLLTCEVGNQESHRPFFLSLSHFGIHGIPHFGQDSITAPWLTP